MECDFIEIETDDGENYAVYCKVSTNLQASSDESFLILNNYVWLDPMTNGVVRLFRSPMMNVTPLDFYLFTQSILAETVATMAWQLPEGLLASAALWIRDFVRAVGPTGGTVINVAINGPHFSGGDEVVLGYNMREEEEEENRMVPANRDAIEALEEVDIARVRVRVRASDDDNEVDLCSICLDEFSDDDCRKMVKMPCSHVYHKDCLVRWLEKSHMCPFCRFALPTSLGDQ